MRKFPDRLQCKIEERKKSNSLRKLVSTVGLVDFCSNDYLGLSRSKVLSEHIAHQAYLNFSKSIGSTGSRLISGNNPLIEDLESKLADFFQSESALFFNSGYSANVALLSSIPQRGDTIIHDELIHASIKDGMRLSFASKVSFKHNDLIDLDKKLQASAGDKYVVVEAIYSMDGDISNIREVLSICNKYGAYLIVDEAHSVGVLGEAGQGLCIKESLEGEVFARVYTFGKAVGVCGACVAGGDMLVEYLVNFARAFIYTTAPSTHDVLSVGCAIDLMKSVHHERQNLYHNIEHFRNQMNEKINILMANKMRMLDSQTAIQGVIVSGNDVAKKISEQLQHLGLDVRAILSPTVKKGFERLRICLHSYNTQEEIDMLVNGIISR